MWIVGDEFLHDIYHALQKLKTEAIIAKHHLPYVYDYYNITFFTPSPKSLLKNTLARVVNAVTKALNDTLKLPRIILVIVDHDILKFVDTNEYGIRHIVSECLNWCITRINRAVDSTMDSLSRRKPGAIISGKPKIIWAKMINRRWDEDNFLLKNRNKFNDAMDDILFGLR